MKLRKIKNIALGFFGFGLFILTCLIWLLSFVTYYVDNWSRIENKLDYKVLVHPAITFDSTLDNIEINHIGEFEPQWHEIQPNEVLTLGTAYDHDYAQLAGVFIKKNSKVYFLEIAELGDAKISITPEAIKSEKLLPFKEKLNLVDTTQKKSLYSSMYNFIRWFWQALLLTFISFVLLFLSFRKKI